MSHVARRALSTLIPPKVASPGGIPKNDLGRMVSFYEALPKSSAPQVKPRGLVEWYRQKYFGDKASGMPLVHVIGAMMLIGYVQNYYWHLRHHKNNAH